MSTKINKIAHYCNFSIISFFKSCMEEAAVATVIFELNLFQIFGPKDDIIFYLFLFYKVVYPMPSAT